MAGIAAFGACADHRLGQCHQVDLLELGAAELSVDPAGVGNLGHQAVDPFYIVRGDRGELGPQLIVLDLFQGLQRRAQAGERVLDLVRHVGRKGLDRVDPVTQGSAHVRQCAGEQPDLVAAVGQPRHFDRTVASQPDADRGADQRAQRLDYGAREEQRKLDRQQQRHPQDNCQCLAGIAHRLRNIGSGAGGQQQFALVAHRAGGVDHRGLVGRGAAGDHGDLAARGLHQFGPAGRRIGRGVAVSRDLSAAERPVHRAVEHPRDIAVPWVLSRIGKDEAGPGEDLAVERQPPISAVQPQPQVLIFADLFKQSGAPARRSLGQGGGCNLNLGSGQLEPFREQLLAQRIEVEQAPRHQPQRDQVDRQNAHGQRGAPGPVGPGQPGRSQPRPGGGRFSHR